MKAMLLLTLAAFLLCVLPPDASAQRRKATKKEGEPATVIYRQDFSAKDNLDGFAAGDAGGTVEWVSTGIDGTAGAMKISGKYASGDKKMDWTDKETSISFAYFANGAKNCYVLGYGQNSGKKLHAYFPNVKNNEWTRVKFNAASFVGFGGGGGVPGENFKSLEFVLEETDKSSENPYLLIDDIVIFNGEDGKAPSSPPQNLSGEFSPDKKSVHLNWKPAKDDVAIMKYDIHRSESPAFEADRKNCIASTAENSFSDSTASPSKTYYYAVVAKDVGGYALPSNEIEVKIPSATESKTNIEF